MTSIIYACSHATWLPETIRSAHSCQAVMPTLARELWVTRDLRLEAGTMLESHFDKVHTIEQPRHEHRPKFESLLECTAERALFIDGDTYFTADVSELFGVLDHFEIGLAAAPQNFHPKARQLGLYDLLPQVSMAMPEWNGGVIVARVDDRFREFVRRWSELFTRCRQHGYQMDQVALRAALATSELRIATLPANYNFRANMRQTIKGQVKILHAHGDLPKIASYINESAGVRHYDPREHEIDGFRPRSPD